MFPDAVPFPEAVPFPVGPYTPQDFPEADVAGAEKVRAKLDSVRSATYTGRDPEHIASAAVTGSGVVTQVRFAATAATRSLPSLERAVLAAVAAAQARKDEAWQAVLAQEFPDVPELATAVDASARGGADGYGTQTHGGIEMAYEPPAGDDHD